MSNCIIAGQLLSLVPVSPHYPGHPRSAYPVRVWSISGNSDLESIAATERIRDGLRESADEFFDADWIDSRNLFRYCAALS